MSKVASQTQRQGTTTPLPASGVLQRKCACGNQTLAGGECGACSKNRLSLQRRAVDNQSEHSEVPPIVHEVLRSPGQPLGAETRAFMEPRFSHDFSRVRVHTDAKAAESARSVNALAYTVGRNVVFGEGHYAPGARTGRSILAHELVHIGDGRNDSLRPLFRQIGRRAASLTNMRISGRRPEELTSDLVGAMVLHARDQEAGNSLDLLRRAVPNYSVADLPETRENKLNYPPRW